MLTLHIRVLQFRKRTDNTRPFDSRSHTSLRRGEGSALSSVSSVIRQSHFENEGTHIGKRHSGGVTGSARGNE